MTKKKAKRLRGLKRYVREEERRFIRFFRKEEKQIRRLGHWLFIAGLALALFFGLVLGAVPGPLAKPSIYVSIMLILGIIVGLSLIRVRVVTEFLLGALVLLVGSSASALVLGALWERLTWALGYLMVFVFAASFIAALRAIIQAAEAS